MKLSNTYARSNLTSGVYMPGVAARGVSLATFVSGTQGVLTGTPYKCARFAPVRFSKYVKPILSR
jgi:hypothetical protein